MTTENLLLSEPKEICIVARASMNGSDRRVSVRRESPEADFTPG